DAAIASGRTGKMMACSFATIRRTEQPVRGIFRCTCPRSRESVHEFRKAFGSRATARQPAGDAVDAGHRVDCGQLYFARAVGDRISSGPWDCLSAFQEFVFEK